MNKIYILHSGLDIVEYAISNSKYKERIISVNPKVNSVLFKIKRRLYKMFNLKFENYWFKYIFKNLKIDNDKDNVIILFDHPMWINNLEYIRTKYDKIKIVFWYWNTVIDEKELQFIKSRCDSIFTFDKKDAEKYDLKYSPQFYCFENQNNQIIENKNCKTDLYFVGLNKNRLPLLEKIYLECENKNIKTKFYVMRDNIYQESKYFKLHKKAISYEEVIKDIKNSKCILDITKEGQTGLTLRVLEALFLRKKLITNNKDLVNYDFYNKNNIFILNENSKIDVEFINSKYEEVDESIIEKYSVDTWISNLIE